MPDSRTVATDDIAGGRVGTLNYLYSFIIHTGGRHIELLICIHHRYIDTTPSNTL